MAFLFGSAARSRRTADSDLDVAVCPVVIKDLSLYWGLFLAVSSAAEDFRKFTREFLEIKQRSRSLSEVDRDHLRRISDSLSDSSRRRNVERWVENIGAGKGTPDLPRNPAQPGNASGLRAPDRGNAVPILQASEHPRSRVPGRALGPDFGVLAAGSARLPGTPAIHLPGSVVRGFRTAVKARLHGRLGVPLGDVNTGTTARQDRSRCSGRR